MTEKKKYDSTVARIAGNLLSGCVPSELTPHEMAYAAEAAVQMARAIVAEVKRTEPDVDHPPVPCARIVDVRCTCGEPSMAFDPHDTSCPLWAPL